MSRPVSLHPPTPRTGLEEFFRSVPWLLLVLVCVLAGWTATEVTTLAVALVPVVALAGRRKAA